MYDETIQAINTLASSAPTGTLRTEPSTIIIPRWIYQALVRHHVEMKDILDIDRIKSVLSDEDIAEWCYVNDQYTILKHHLSDCGLTSLFKDTDRLVNMPYIKERVDQRLRYDSTDIVTQPKCYETINVNQTVLVIIGEGFDATMRSIESCLDFLRVCLKAHARVFTITEVSQLPLHSLYIELL